MGHFSLFEREPAASVVRANLVSRVILIFRINQATQLLFSTKFSYWAILILLLFISSINKSIGRLLCLPFENPGPAEAGPCQKRASSRFEAGTSGLLSISDSEHRVPTELGQESQASSCVEEWNSTGLSSCSLDNRPLVELCVEPAGFSRRCTVVSLPLHLVPSPTGLPSKRCPSIGFISRADREIEVVRHVAPPTWLISNFLVRPASSWGAPGRPGTPSTQRRGIDSPVAIRRGDGAQMKWGRDSRCSTRGNPAFQGTLGVASREPSTVSHFRTEHGTSLETLS